MLTTAGAQGLPSRRSGPAKSPDAAVLVGVRGSFGFSRSVAANPRFGICRCWLFGAVRGRFGNLPKCPGGLATKERIGPAAEAESTNRRYAAHVRRVLARAAPARKGVALFSLSDSELDVLMTLAAPLDWRARSAPPLGRDRVCEP